MKIVDLLKVESIDLKAQPKDKAAALEHLITLMESGGNLLDKDEYRACVLRREEEGSTGIGEGIAIPHAKTSAVKAPGLAAMLVKDGVDFDSLDGEPAKLFFLIAAPDTKDNVHLDVLSHLSMLLMNDNFRGKNPVQLCYQQEQDVSLGGTPNFQYASGNVSMPYKMMVVEGGSLGDIYGNVFVRDANGKILLEPTTDKDGNPQRKKPACLKLQPTKPPR